MNADNRVINTDGIRVWNDAAAVVWRPAGCIDTQTFLPLFIDYLTEDQFRRCVRGASKLSSTVG